MIKLIKSTFYHESETKQALVKFIERAKTLSFGEECEKFEKNFAKYQQRKYCVFVNSGSSANLALIQTMLNLGKLELGDKVGFSALTWSTNVMPLIQLGLVPVAIDVELDTLNISSQKLLAVLKKHQLKAVFITNLLGFCDDIDQVKKICTEKGIVLLEDNCESLGSVYKDKKLGNFGLASTFSFYVGHHLSTIEGGAICTDNLEFSTMLRLVRAHGWDRNLTIKGQEKIRAEHQVNSSFYSRYTFYDLGYNFRATEINGFIGNTQLKYVKEIVEKRRDNFFKLAASIYQNSDKYYPIKYEHLDVLSNFAFPIICRSKKIRDELVEKCNNQVEIRPVVAGNMTEQPFYQKRTKQMNVLTPNATLIHDQGLYFGNNPELTEAEINTLIKIFS